MRDPLTSPRYKVQVLHRACRILDALSDAPRELTPVEIATRLRLHKSTIHRLLMVLESERFIRRTGDGKYGLGMKLVEMGSRAMDRLDLGAHAVPYLERLVETVGETAHIAVLSGTDMVSIANVPGKWTLRTPSTVGRRTETYCTAVGKAVLAELDPEELDRIIAHIQFRRRTRRTIVTAAALRAELQRIRRRGFSMDDEEIEEGLRCIAAPVRNFTGRVVAAIAIAGPIFRVRKSRLPEIVRAVKATADDLSANLGYMRPVIPKAGTK